MRKRLLPAMLAILCFCVCQPVNAAGGIPDGVGVNPATPGLPPDLTPEQAAEQERLAAEYLEYQNLCAAADYLRAALPPSDYGGLYISEQLTLTVWAVCRDNADKAIQSYQGEPVEFAFKTARCSLEDMAGFTDAVNGVALKDGEFLRAGISELENAVSVTVSKYGEGRLRSEIDALIQAGRIPPECVFISAYDSTVENPAT